jgi:ParB family chromosome partitioning protein
MSVRAVEDAIKARNELGTGVPGRAAQRSRLRPPGVLELEELLSSHLQTRVKVDLGAKRGRVTIDFATLEDLERIYRAMTEPSTED